VQKKSHCPARSLPPLLFRDAGAGGYSLNLTVEGTSRNGQFFHVKLNPIQATIQPPRAETEVVEKSTLVNTTPAQAATGLANVWLVAGAANLALVLVVGILFWVVLRQHKKRLHNKLEHLKST
jgi:Flp pilus assembly protein TadB